MKHMLLYVTATFSVLLACNTICMEKDNDKKEQKVFKKILKKLTSKNPRKKIKPKKIVEKDEEESVEKENIEIQAKYDEEAYISRIEQRFSKTLKRHTRNEQT
ncbi:hypothetical protein ACFLYA_02225 [Candidatus Dependentiae bacterium]